MKASHKGENDIVRRLIGAGARLDARNADGANALWLACVGAHPDTMDALIEAGVEIDNQNDNGATALMYAASTGKGDRRAPASGGRRHHARDAGRFQRPRHGGDGRVPRIAAPGRAPAGRRRRGGSSRLDHDDFGSNRSEVMNVINSNSFARDAREKVLTLFLIPL